MVLYNIFDARHSDGVIQLVNPPSYDTHLLVTFITEFVSYGVTPTVCDICRSFLNFDLATFPLVLCFTLVFEELWY